MIDDQMYAAPEQVRELAAFRLNVLAGFTGKLSDLFFEREFGLRTIECRVLGVVDAFQPVSLRRACAEIELDKSQGSRIVARLEEAGWLERHEDPADQRSFFLSLTPAGHALHERLKRAAVEWNRQWLAGMPVELESAFHRALEWQILHARELLERELAGEGAVLPSLPAGAVRAEGARPLLVERQQLEDLHRRIGELLGVPPPEPAAEPHGASKRRQASRVNKNQAAQTRPRTRRPAA